MAYSAYVDETGRGGRLMDKDRLKKEAVEFCKEGSCYIHCEMKDSRSPELLICGDFLGMMHCVCGLINRIAYKTGNDFEHTAMTIFNMPRFGGYDNIKSMLKDGGYRFIEGEDWQEDWKKEKEKEIKREANIDNIQLAINMAEMEKRNTSLNNQLVDLKKEYSKNIKAKDEQIKKLTKECQALEHRMKEMEEQRLFPMGE